MIFCSMTNNPNSQCISIWLSIHKLRAKEEVWCLISFTFFFHERLLYNVLKCCQYYIPLGEKWITGSVAVKQCHSWEMMRWWFGFWTQRWFYKKVRFITALLFLRKSMCLLSPKTWSTYSLRRDELLRSLTQSKRMNGNYCWINVMTFKHLISFLSVHSLFLPQLNRRCQAYTSTDVSFSPSPFSTYW